MTGQFEDLGWGVAPIPTKHDVGTDLWLHARDARLFELGALIGAQVKAGSSWFGKPSRDDDGVVDGWWYTDQDDRHFKYWTEHRVPHILVLHNPDTRRSYWVHITKDRVHSTGLGSKILVPVSNTIDDEHVTDLLRVAAGDREGIRWEGSAWAGGETVSRADRLRHALLTPRLIAPHPNLSVTELRFEEALALLVKMRLRDLDPRDRRETGAPTIESCRTSGEWGWRLYAAAHDAIVDGAGTSAIEALIDQTEDAFEKTAAAALTCAMMVEDGDPARGLAVTTRVLDTDECCPVDHAWLSLHRARCLAELGDLEQARDLAIEVQVLRNVAPHDPTAMAIMGASTDLIFTTSSWEAQKIPEAITGRDTLAAWWRTQEISWGLQHQFESNFKHWYQDSSARWGASDQTWLHLRAASLIAGLAGDHSGWRHAFGLLARRVLTTTTTDTEAMAPER